MSVRVRCLIAALLVALGGLALTAPTALVGLSAADPIASSEALVGVGATDVPDAARIAAEPRVKRSATFHTTARLLVVLAPLLGVAGATLVTRRRHDADAAAPALIRARSATPRAPPALAV
jgi:hypothetical protein